MVVEQRVSSRAGGVVRIGIVIAALVAALASATPYQEKGFRGGFETTDLGGGRYMISVEVNGYTNRNTAIEYTYRRAAEVCPAGYDVVDNDRAGRYKATAMLVVQCRTAAAPQSTNGPPGEQ